MGDFHPESRLHYDLHERIDTGGMAEVFRASASTDNGPPKTVAFKRLLPHVVADPKLVEMFLDEAKLAILLTHPHIVEAYESGRHEGSYFLSMEWIDGVNLRRVLQRCVEVERRIPLGVICYIGAAIADALSYIHQVRDEEGRSLGVIHRDISPPNILLTYAGLPKLIDFGLCKSEMNQSVTDPGIVKGKYGYLCPQAASGEVVDQRTDIFALGVCLWEMVARRRLFWAQDDAVTVARVRDAIIPPLMPHHDQVERAFEVIVLQALSRDVSVRYANAAMLAEALRSYADESSLDATAVHTSQWLNLLFERPCEPDMDIVALLRRRLGTSTLAEATRAPASAVSPSEGLAHAHTADKRGDLIERLLVVARAGMNQK